MSQLKKSLPRSRDNWVVSSFGEVSAEFARPRKAAKTKLKGVKTASLKDRRCADDSQLQPRQGTKHDLWIEKYQPLNEDQLAVHKKKYEDVRSWFDECLSSSSKRSLMLLLTGPAGAGKTATVHVLAAELGLEVCEWTNQPGVNVNYGFQVFDASQVDTFKDFLLRSSRYTNQIFIDVNHKQKVILIEDFPSAFASNVQELHEIIRIYDRVGTCPLILVVTDSSSNAANEMKLFPLSFQQEMAITKLSFNPVSQTSMVRVLTRIADAEGLDVNKATLEVLAENSCGDVRSAVNALQFGYGSAASSTCEPSRKMQKTTSRGRTSKKSRRQHDAGGGANPAPAFGSRDDSLFLFHALGKILYCKRDYDKAASSTVLPANLQIMERPPLLIDPENIWEKTSASGATFSAFLHQNYVQFSSDIDDVCRTSGYLSASDTLLSEWMGTEALDPYIASIVTRGIMHCDRSRVTSGFRPLHKPQLFSVLKSSRENYAVARNLFQESFFHLPREELFAQAIPFVTNFLPYALTGVQKAVLNRAFPPLSLTNSASRSDLLNKCYMEIDDGDSLIPESGAAVFHEGGDVQTNCHLGRSNEVDAEYVIEEYNF